MTTTREAVRDLLYDLDAAEDKHVTTVTATYLSNYLDATPHEVGTALKQLDREGHVELLRRGTSRIRYTVTLDEEVPA